jgi:putative ABC transport system permease protein
LVSTEKKDSIGSRVLRFLRPLFQLMGAVKLVLKRQRHHLRLTLLALLNIILAVGLVTNSYFFSQAVDRVILTQELYEFSSDTGRPPFATSIYIFPSTRVPLSLEDAEKASRDIANTLSGEVGLPLRQLVTEVSSGGFMLQMADEARQYLGDTELVYMDGISEHMEIVEGEPLDEKGQSGEVMDIWMHDRLAQKMGVHIGETLNLSKTVTETPMLIRIAGFWKAKDPESEYWFNDPDQALAETLLVRRNDYISRLQPLIPSKTRGAYWYVILDDTKIKTQDSASYVEGFNRGLSIINKFMPGARLNTPPLAPLKNFIQRSTTMAIQLLSYNLPAFGILLYFMLLTAAIVAQWQRKETSILVSRGMSRGGVMALTFFEQMLLFVIGYPLGILLGMGIGWVMGFSSSFLSFTVRDPLPVSLEGLSLNLTLLALGISLLARLAPTLQAGRSSIVTEEREWARPLRDPFWHRYYLDLLLIIPTWYAYDQMVKQGSLAGLITQNKTTDLYNDPLLILVPALFIVTACLVTMRLFALVMKLVDYLAGSIPGVAVYLTLRQFGRQSYDYVRPLLLVIVSLALGVYTLSMAVSLDQWLIDRMYYKVGTDLAISPSPNVPDDSLVDGSWIPEPFRFAEIPGVAAATRVGDYYARFTSNGREVPGRVLAVDRLDFPSVAWFRSDFSDESLGGLMNRLAATEEGILISEEALEQSGLQIGDQVSAAVDVSRSARVSMPFTIVGTYKYFPTVNEETNYTTVIANLEYLSSMYGLTVDHNMWMKVQPGADTKQILKDMTAATSVVPLDPQDAQALIAAEQAKMERVGIFGTLSVGFMATSIMAILGLLIFSYASLQERLYRYAILHAVGLPRRKIMLQVTIENSFLALFGATAGAFIGIYASMLFLPFFRYTGEKGVPLPPLVPVIAGDQVKWMVLIFTLIIIVAEWITIATAFRTQLAKIIKRPW